MKHEDIDKLIEQALTEEEAAFYHELDEQNMFQMVGGLFKGKMAFINVLVTFFALVAFILAVYYGIEFFYSNDVLYAIKTGAAMMIFIMMNAMMKIQQWMQIDKNAIIRELKRAELQISALASKIEKKGE